VVGGVGGRGGRHGCRDVVGGCERGFLGGTGAGMQVGGVGIERQKRPVDRQEKEPWSENGWDAGLARSFIVAESEGLGRW